MPFANWKGAAAGMIVSHITVLFVTFGHLSIDKSVQFLETSIAGCTNQSFSSDLTKPTTSMLLSFSNHQPIIVDKWSQNVTTEVPIVSSQHDDSLMHTLFSVSYMYYAFFGTLITVVVGIVVSLLTMSKNDAYDSKYIHPVVYKVTKLFPGSEQLFSNEDPLTEIPTSSLKESQVPQSVVNLAFDMKSEEILASQEKPSVIYNSNITYNSEKNFKAVESEHVRL